MYLVKCTKPDIVFIARYDATQQRDIGLVSKLPLGAYNVPQDFGLWFPKNQVPTMVGYVHDGYMPNSHDGTGFVFLYGGTTISWRSMKQILVDLSTNHSEIIAFYGPHNNVLSLDGWLATSKSYVV